MTKRFGQQTIVGLVVAFAFLARLPTLARSLVEAHTFRQTQTAYTALIYHRDGINLLQTPLPIFGPPWVVPFEFPLFQGIAALVMDAGAPPDFALRLTSLGFFAISAAILWAIVSMELNRRAASLVLLMFVFAPLGLLWSRTSTIETLAVATSLAAVLFALRWDRGGSNGLLLMSCLCAGIAALVKLPTAALWLAPAGLLLSRRRPLGVVVPVSAATIGLLWTSYMDGIKGSIPATNSLTSAALHDWLLGTAAQRLDPDTWLVLAIWASALFGLVILIRPAVLRESRIGRWSAMSLVLGPAVFTNVYVVHDYYWMAVAPAAAILSGLVAESVLNTPSRNLRWLRMVAVIGSLAIAFLAYPRVARTFEDFDESDTIRLAAEIRAATLPSDLVAIRGRDWSPGLLYYADRRGFMEWPGAPIAPPGYILFECPSEAERGECVRVGVTTGNSP